MPLLYSSTSEWERLCTRVARLATATTVLNVATVFIGLGLLVSLSDWDSRTIGWSAAFILALALRLWIAMWQSRARREKSEFEWRGREVLKGVASDLRAQLPKADVAIELTTEAREALISEGLDRYRESHLDILQRTVERRIENEVARRILESELELGERVEVDHPGPNAIQGFTGPTFEEYRFYPGSNEDIDYDTYVLVDCDNDGCEEETLGETVDAYWEASLAAIRHVRETGHGVVIRTIVAPD